MTAQLPHFVQASTSAFCTVCARRPAAAAPPNEFPGISIPWPLLNESCWP